MRFFNSIFAIYVRNGVYERKIFGEQLGLKQKNPLKDNETSSGKQL